MSSSTFSASEFYSKTQKITHELLNILQHLFKERRRAYSMSTNLENSRCRKQQSAMSVRRKCKLSNSLACSQVFHPGITNNDGIYKFDLLKKENEQDIEIQHHFVPITLRCGTTVSDFTANCALRDEFSHFYRDKCEEPVRHWESHHSRDRKHRLSSSSLSSRTYYICVLLISVLLVNSLLINSVEGCGPGRGVGRRRAPRKLTPLVYKQHVPNIPEHHTAASGNFDGPIRPDNHKRFKELVPNYNMDIIFRDEEGTGADRLMNLRCKEKLNTLAISVMNQWPGVKLRVIEGWDNTTGPQTRDNSLHYEGRAVDITTSDRDRSKYGMLARLAVEAGFDWVYYESRQYIHCSVKSDSSQGGRTGGCFSGNSTVQTRHRGVQHISNVVPGDELLTVDSYGQLDYSPILLFLDRNQSEVREFLQITTESGRQLKITPSHLLYSLPDQIQPNYYNDYFSKNSISGIRSRDDFQEEALSMANPTFARNVEIGDWLLLVSGGNSTTGISWSSSDGADGRVKSNTKHLVLERVVDIQIQEETGVYAPLTATGTIVVNDVVSSCYAVVQSQSLAHWSFLPVRFLHNFSRGLSQLWKQFSLLVTLSSAPADRQGESAFVDLVQTRIKSHESQVKSLNAHDQGIHWYASMLYSLTSRLLPSHYLYGS